MQISHISKEYQLAKNVFIDDIPYAEISLGTAIKIGYMCEKKAMIFPIYLEMDGEYRKLQIGKTCIFEVSGVEITGVRIPNGIKFTLDYICEQ
jgi:hypothetical protein